MTPVLAWPDHPFTRADLPHLGITEGQLRAGLRARDIQALFRGVFIAGDPPLTIHLRAQALVRVVAPHHVVTDRTAAWVHGVDTYVWSEHDGVPIIEMCALRGHEPTAQARVDSRTRDLRPEDLMVVAGITVTTPLRTGLDLGCCLRRREAYAALNALAARHGLTREDYLGALPRFYRRRGVRQLRVLTQIVDPRVESERESWVLLAICDATLRTPEPQYWIEIDGVPTYRLDFAYPRIRVCIEYDGADWHDRTPAQRGHDAARRAWLRENGWTVIVVRRGDFTGERLDRWIGELRRALQPAYSNRRW
jgi:very-short-patch-repair endonuclease